MGRVEQAFGRKLLSQLFESALQSAVTRIFHVFDDELKVAARLVQTHARAHQHLHALGGFAAQQGGTVAEQGAAHLRGGILEGEIQMPGGRTRQIGELAFYPQQREAAFQQRPRLVVEA